MNAASRCTASSSGVETDRNQIGSIEQLTPRLLSRAYHILNRVQPTCVCVVRLQLNELRTHVADTNRRLMAASAELSVKQAAALSLRQEIRERELQVRDAQTTAGSWMPTTPQPPPTVFLSLCPIMHLKPVCPAYLQMKRVGKQNAATK